MLDAKVEVYSGGTLIAAADGSNNDQHLTFSYLEPGTYVVVVKGHGDYGDLGLYDLKVTTQSGVPAPRRRTTRYPPRRTSTLARGTGTTVSVGWNAVPGATGYAIDRSSDGITWTQVRTTQGNTPTNIIDSGMNGGRRYFFRVAALDGRGRSAPSAVSQRRHPADGRVFADGHVVEARLTDPQSGATSAGRRVTASSARSTRRGHLDDGRHGRRQRAQLHGDGHFRRATSTASASSRPTSLGDSAPAEVTGVTRLPAITGLAFTARNQPARDPVGPAVRRD